jgi:hypothetical protein
MAYRPEDLAEIMVGQGYDEQTILTVLDIFSKVRDPNQLIEILPDEDIANDLICQSCITNRRKSGCDEPLLPGRVAKGGFEGLRFNLHQGDKISVEELLQKKQAFGPHFKINNYLYPHQLRFIRYYCYNLCINYCSKKYERKF